MDYFLLSSKESSLILWVQSTLFFCVARRFSNRVNLNLKGWLNGRNQTKISEFYKCWKNWIKNLLRLRLRLCACGLELLIFLMSKSRNSLFNYLLMPLFSHLTCEFGILFHPMLIDGIVRQSWYGIGLIEQTYTHIMTSQNPSTYFLTAKISAGCLLCSRFRHRGWNRRFPLQQRQ